MCCVPVGSFACQFPASQPASQPARQLARQQASEEKGWARMESNVIENEWRLKRKCQREGPADTQWRPECNVAPSSRPQRERLASAARSAHPHRSLLAASPRRLARHRAEKEAEAEADADAAPPPQTHALSPLSIEAPQSAERGAPQVGLGTARSRQRPLEFRVRADWATCAPLSPASRRRAVSAAREAASKCKGRQMSELEAVGNLAAGVP